MASSQASTAGGDHSSADFSSAAFTEITHVTQLPSPQAVCPLCRRIRSSLHRFPDHGVPHYSCLACWLARAIQQCAQALSEDHPEYWRSVRDLLEVHSNLSAAAREEWDQRFPGPPDHSPRHLPASPPGWPSQTGAAMQIDADGVVHVAQETLDV